jgi:hypothetical protein
MERLTSAGLSVGRTSVPVFAATVPEFDVSAGVSIPLRGAQLLCVRAGMFLWDGPSAILLTQEYFKSSGWYWTIGSQRSIPLTHSAAIVPSFTYSRRAVRTMLTYLPAADWQPPDSTARFSMSSLEVGLGLVVDSIGLLWIAVERPYGMPTSTRFAPLGRENGESAITIGFGFAFRDRSRPR